MITSKTTANGRRRALRAGDPVRIMDDGVERGGWIVRRGARWLDVECETAERGPYLTTVGAREATRIDWAPAEARAWRRDRAARMAARITLEAAR